MSSAMKAISVRQPWAWLITRGHKPVENRTWKTKQRGLVLIHAAKGMTREEYDIAHGMAMGIDPSMRFPWFENMERGGLVGMAEITDCVDSCSSPWFVGPYGFMLRGAVALPFVPMPGRLGLFDAGLEGLPAEYRAAAAAMQ